MITQNTNVRENLRNRWSKPCNIPLNEYETLIHSVSEDDSDLHQRSLCEQYRSKADFNTFHTHDTLELTRNQKRRHWTGVEAIRSDCHLIR